VAGLSAVAGLLLAGCGGNDAADGGRADAIEETGLDLYLPEFADVQPNGVRVRDGNVEVEYRDDDGIGFTLVEQSVPDGDLCRTLFAPYQRGGCDFRAGVLRETFEELSAIGVIRGDTFLFVRSVDTETDRGLIEKTVVAMQKAPEVAPDDLAAL
jgi:hypothetical protein